MSSPSALLEALFTQLALVILEARVDGEEEVIILTDALRDAITATARHFLREPATFSLHTAPYKRMPLPPLAAAAREIITAFSPDASRDAELQAWIARELDRLWERTAEEYRARMAAEDWVNPFAARSYTHDDLRKLFPYDS